MTKKDITLQTLHTMKANKEKIAVLTAYDACFARLQGIAGVDIILVGDSLGMVLQGHDSTLPVTIEQMVYHVSSVKKGIHVHSFLMADMPFMTFGETSTALDNAKQLLQAGAQMVKLEGGAWLSETISKLVQNGIPVCSHLGLMPQSVHALGGFKVQGRQPNQAQQILQDAKTLESAGASLLILECVPAQLAADISQSLSIPVIGIGSGPHCDGQVLVMHDMLGLTPEPRPRFVRNFLVDNNSIADAFAAYVTAVKQNIFPDLEIHSYLD